VSTVGTVALRAEMGEAAHQSGAELLVKADRGRPSELKGDAASSGRAIATGVPVMLRLS